MRRIVTKNWKVIAYIIGYVVLIVAELDTLNTVYVGVGMAWLVLWLLRNNDGSRTVEHDLSDSRGHLGAFSAYNHNR
ncbi:hypothetical protein HGE68_02245 [Rhodobacteraceae bacterium R_SAG6]|nr:hypothetical protein [Rhodobacteraceae bacterium R_SAG6]